MLLTILNLPNTVKYNEIKALVYAKSGIQDVILDNLTSHENQTKKVTVGLSGEEDAAIFMRKMNGVYMNGKQLQVITKSRIPDSNVNKNSSAAISTNILPSLTMPGASWYPINYGLQGQAMASQNVPGMDPVSSYNMYPNQSAYYQINQPAYSAPSTSSTEMVRYPQPYSYGNRSNQTDNPTSWSYNNWNQQQKQPAGGYSDSRQNNNRETKWDNNQEYRNESNWDNNQGDRNDSDWDNNRRSQRSTDNTSSYNINQQPKWNETRDTKRSNNPDSDRNSRWGNNRDTNRDSYQSNQSFGSTRQYDSSYMRNDETNTDSSFRNVYGDHVTVSSGRGRNEQADKSDERGYKSGRNRSPYARGPSPAAKRSRFSRYDDDRTERRDRGFSNNNAPDSSGFKGNKNFGGPQSDRNRSDRSDNSKTTKFMWRAQLASKYANELLRDKTCIYEGVDFTTLYEELKSLFRERFDNLFKNDFGISIINMDKRYRAKYNQAGHIVLLKDTVKKLGGHLITVSTSQPAPSTTNKKKNKKPNKGPGGNFNLGQQQGPYNKKAAQGGNFGGNSNFGQQQGPYKKKGAQGGNFGGNSNFGQQQGPYNKKAAKGGSFAEKKNNQNKNNNTPLAQIPGRIPQFPKGDKAEHKRQKKAAENIFNDHNYLVNMMSTLKPAVKLAIGEEVAIISKVIEDACNDPYPDDAKFGEKVKQILPKKMSSVLKINLTKRIKPILPLQVCAFSTPPVKRWLLENYLTNFNVSSFKKFKSKPVFLVDCNSVEDYDKLCFMGPVLVGKSTLNFKPFHLGGSREKANKSQIAKQRQEIRDAQFRHSNKNLGYSERDFWDVAEGEGEGKGLNVDVAQQELEQEQICQEIKEIYDQINNPENIENFESKTEEYIEAPIMENKSPQDFKQENDTENVTDFTTDVDIDNFEGNHKEEKDCSAEQNTELAEDDKKEGNNAENDLDFADIDEDDLEDW